MRLGVCDIGTNSIHMLIVEIGNDLRLREIDKAKEMVRLGKGTFETGRLDEDIQRRALTVIQNFRRMADRRGVDRYLAVATSAVREAENGGAFLQEVYERTGIKARVISGVEEGRLVFRAVQSVLPLDDTPTLVLDLGGGSVEFAFGTQRGLSWCTSMPLGVQRLEPTALMRGEVTPETNRAVREVIREAIAPVVKRAKTAGVARAYITSGSGAAILKILQARQEVRDDDSVFSKEMLQALDDEIALLPRAKRAELPSLEPDRIDLIVPAVVLLRELVDALDLAALGVSSRGLREGLVLEFLDRHGPELQWELTEPNQRRREVLRFAERLSYDAPHAQQVAALALALCKDTQDLHQLDDTSRELLEYAALLHDVGFAVAEKRHHKHTEYLILNGLAGGFNDSEIRRIAAIARYHRRSGPKSSHDNWSSLGRRDREAVRRAAALLRIADGLDREHVRAVRMIHANLTDHRVHIEVEADGPIELELWAAKKKSDLFEETFGLPVEFLVVPTQPAKAAPAKEE